MSEEQKMNQTVGRRKTSVARVRMVTGTGKVSVNGRDITEYFPIPRQLHTATSGLQLTDTADKYNLIIRVHGGGTSGQAGAIRHGIARALEVEDSNFRDPLKKAGFLRRDSRMVERKKYGLHKARRGTQFSKR